jgi:hypothetical protein
MPFAFLVNSAVVVSHSCRPQRQNVGGGVGSGICIGGTSNKLVGPLDLNADDANALASVTPRKIEALR